MEIISNLTREFESDIAERLKAKGMIVVPHEELDIEAFQKSVRDSVRAKFDGIVWPAGLMDEVLNVGRE